MEFPRRTNTDEANILLGFETYYCTDYVIICTIHSFCRGDSRSPYDDNQDSQSLMDTA